MVSSFSISMESGSAVASLSRRAHCVCCSPLHLSTRAFERVCHVSSLLDSEPCASSSTFASTSSPKPAQRRSRFSKYGGLCGTFYNNLEDALVSFNKLLSKKPTPSVVEFNEVLGSIVRMKYYSSAISLMKQMHLLYIMPDLCNLSILINCFCSMNKLNAAFSVLAIIWKLGLEPNSITCTSLVKGLCYSGSTSEAVHFFKKMVQNGWSPNIVAYTTMIKGLSNAHQHEVAIKLLGNMRGSNCPPDLIAFNTVIGGLCKDGLVIEASKLFYKMIEEGIAPDVFTYSALVQSTSRLGQWMETENWLNDMRSRNVKLDKHVFTIVIDSMCKVGLVVEAEERILKHMIQCGQEPDIVTYNVLMNGYCRLGQIDKALDIFDSLNERGCTADAVSHNILINGFGRNGRIEEALRWFQLMPNAGLARSTVSYSAVIRGLCVAGRTEEALQSLDEMRIKGIRPDISTYSAILDGYFQNHRVDEAMAFFKAIEDIEPHIYLSICNVLIEGLCSVRKSDFAKEIFGHLSARKLQPELCSFNKLISVFCEEGLVGEAYDLLHAMEEGKCLPNNWTYNVVAQGFLQSKNLLKAKQLFLTMIERGFSVDAVTVSRLLDLLAVGRLDNFF